MTVAEKWDSYEREVSGRINVSSEEREMMAFYGGCVAMLGMFVKIFSPLPAFTTDEQLRQFDLLADELRASVGLPSGRPERR